MKEFSRDEFSLFLDALLRTLLELRFGLNGWDRLSASENSGLLADAVDTVLHDEPIRQNIYNRVRLTDGDSLLVQDKVYLDTIRDLFRERVISRFRLPMIRVDPEVWTGQSVEDWKGGRDVLAILTGNEILSIAGEKNKAIKNS